MGDAKKMINYSKFSPARLFCVQPHEKLPITSETLTSLSTWVSLPTYKFFVVKQEKKDNYSYR